MGSVAAYVELHIEQGPRLEEAAVQIGVVEAIVGVRRSRIIFRGQADHAGTTPMERRRDAFLAAADYALRAREHVVTHGTRRSVTNIGVVHVHPGASNIVPGRTEEIMAKAAMATPLKRAIEAEDVALAVISCVTHLTHTTGSIISVDAGRHL